MRKFMMITTAVGLCLAAPAFAQTAADQKGLVTVNLQDVLNNLSADLKVDRANIPVTAQIPINAAANVCGVSVNVLSQQSAGGSPSCTAKTGSQDLTQAVQQQMAAGGSTGNQAGTTAAVSNPAAPAANNPAAPAANNAAAPAKSAAAPKTAQAPAPAANPATPAAPAAPASAAVPPALMPNTAAAPSAAAPAAAAGQKPAASAAAPAAATGTAQSAAQAPASQPAPAAAAAATQAPAQVPAAASAQGRAAAPAAQAASATVDPQMQTKIVAAIGKDNIKPASVSFSISEGMTIPSSVALYPVPATVLQVAPQYQGYSYFATKEKIVIVEPSRHSVIAVIPMGGTSRAEAPAAAPAKASVKFSKEQQDVIRKRVVTTKKPVTTGSATSRLSVEQRVPDSVQLEEFSEDVVREVPTVKTYRYYRQDDGLAVVDPGERRVIEIIR